MRKLTCTPHGIHSFEKCSSERWRVFLIPAGNGTFMRFHLPHLPVFNSLITTAPQTAFPLSSAPMLLVQDEPALDCVIASSIVEFEARDWDALVSLDEPQLRWNFLRAVERSGLSDNAIYLAVRRSDPEFFASQNTSALLGVAVIYRKDIDLLTLASPKLTRLAAKIRQGPLQRLLIVRALSCGPVINNCRSNFFIASDLSNNFSDRVVEVLLQQLKKIRGGGLEVLFEFRDETVTRCGKSFEQAGFIRGDSLPGTRLDIKWPDFDSYLAAMRKVYRRAVRDDFEAAQDLEIQIETNFSHLANEACTLYQNTLERASVVMERLTPEFFQELATLEQSRLVTLREKSSGKLVGIEVLLLTPDGVQDLYTGVDYTLNKRYNLYFNLVYPAIALACENGWAAISMGQTSYAFKSRLGVASYPLHIFVRHRNPIICGVLKLCRRLIFPATEVPTHHVFHDVDN
ncbi:MAG: GNAT family N-acetyltransferase [Abditibacteriaceae bacterium]